MLANTTINTQKLSSTVKALVISAKVDGIKGYIAKNNHELGRLKLVFTYNNIGDDIISEWWFDYDQVNIEA